MLFKANNEISYNIRLCFRLIVFVFISKSLYGQDAIYSSMSIHHPIMAENGMVASQHHLATEIGLDILKQGGNAIDASVAVGFALSVVLPRAGNLGGGGFMLFYDNDKKHVSAVNYRETAPAAATENMYLDKNGEVDNQLFNKSYQSVGVPGTVAGLLDALDEHGTMTVEQILEPSIRLAKNGFPISYDLAALLIKYQDRMKVCQATADIFYPSDSTFFKAGDLLVQKDLAWSLMEISKCGKKAFYDGKVGDKLAKGIQKQGGIITKKDLKSYKVKTYEPVRGTYKGYDIVSMPPPSSGGVHVVQMLNMLEGYDLKSHGHNSAESLHILAETMRLAYADRSKHLGDPDYWDVPTEGLISKSYADELTKKINLEKANKSDDILPGSPADYESEETTHFSVVDKWGNAVSNTYTLNFSFGAGLMIEGTGFLLNNEMGDFSAKPGSANAYGLIGGKANAVSPGKRPLSSMTPTIVLKDGQPVLVTGSPGGSRIISTVLQTILNVIEYEMNIAEASHATRIHHQWYPDKLFHETILNHDTRKLLEQKGHVLSPRGAMGSTQSIMINDGRLMGSSDPRRPDARTIGY